MKILEAKGISKSFYSLKALDRVDFEVEKGEIHALIGENGAGKSTLMKILLGIISMDEGEIFIRGEKATIKTPHNALQLGISMIHQEISLVPELDVSENIWLGRQKQFKKLGLISPQKRLEETKKLLDELKIVVDPKAKVRDLSVAMMQLVEIARAVSYHSDVVIMDEPTSALSETEIHLLYDIVRNLAKKGVATIFISHKLDEIFDIADRVTVLRDGQFVATKKVSDIDQDQLVKMIVGRQLSEMFPKEDAKIRDIVLDVRELRREGVFENVTFQVKAGEIVGFCGLMGAGRTEIMNGIFGIDRIDGGEIFLNGAKISIHSPREAIKSGIGMLTEDRLRLGAIHALSIKYNLSLAYLYKICKMKFVNRIKENSDSKNMVSDLQIKIGDLSDSIGSLSGGNQQKVLFGRALLVNPKVLILDEPTRGIDVGSKAEIHRLCSRLAQKGMAIIMVSSELPEVLGMSDRIYVVRGGRIVGEYNRGEADQETLIKKAFEA